MGKQRRLVLVLLKWNVSRLVVLLMCEILTKFPSEESFSDHLWLPGRSGARVPLGCSLPAEPGVDVLALMALWLRGASGFPNPTCAAVHGSLCCLQRGLD